MEGAREEWRKPERNGGCRRGTKGTGERRRGRETEGDVKERGCRRGTEGDVRKGAADGRRVPERDGRCRRGTEVARE